MMKILSDIWSVMSSFALVDYILYFSVVTLIVLIVSLIYVIKQEKQENKGKQLELEVGSVKNDITNEVEELDLQSIVNTIDEKPTPLIDMTAYEEEQEQKAIISYEELIKMDSPTTINYSDEELVDNIIPVKKIQVSQFDTSNKNEFVSGLKLTQKEPKFEVESNVVKSETKEVRLFSYEKEEAFLQALKQLNELLN